jgi:hypothetical protein
MFPTLPPTFSPAQLLYQQQLEAYYRKRVVVVGVCTGLIGLLCILLGWILLPPLLRRIRPRLQTKKQQQSQIDARYHTVDAWLITKTAQRHDDDCRWVQHFYGSETKANDDLDDKPSPQVLTGQALLQKLGIPDPNRVVEGNKEKTNRQPKHEKRNPLQTTWKILRRQQKKETQAVTESNEPSIRPEDDGCQHDNDLETASNASQCSILDDCKPSCSICLERFKPGDKVSWSSGEECNHTFHHACIREWLLRKSACPYCREFVLPVDRPSAEELGRTPNLTHRRLPLTKERVQVCSVERAHRSTTSYFCVECGLVHLRSFARDGKAKAAVAGGGEQCGACSGTTDCQETTRVSTWKRPWTMMGQQTQQSTADQCRHIPQRQSSSTFRPQQTVDMSESSSSSYEDESDNSSLWSEESDSSREDDDWDGDSLEECSDDDDENLQTGWNDDSSASLVNDTEGSQDESEPACHAVTGDGSVAVVEIDDENQN